MTAPRATYRLQFHAGFRFADAARLAPYLARLGISHVYASPWLKARPGSTHGYDIVDHAALNPELGTEADFRAMVAAFKAHGLGQILDFVPNHMGVGGADNPWWLDVLEWGEASDFAGWFDIGWQAGRLLVPFLGDQYGAVLEAGQLELRFDAAEGRFAIWAYGTHRLPICPLHYGRVLGEDDPVLERLGDAFAGLPDWRPRIAARARDLQAGLAARVAADAARRAAVDRAVAALNADKTALDALIRDQHWRAAHFRVAADDINYRRFFNINELAGLRMELPELFEHAHRLVFALLADGSLDGLRIDHVDGLLDPKGYLLTLREAAPRPFYLVVEKILARHEALRSDWPVQGTTGYEFANLVMGVLLDPAGEAPLTRLYADFTGERQGFAAIVQDCKRRIMRNEMAGELAMLAREAAHIAQQTPRSADFTRNILSRGLAAIVAGFDVYRSYVDAAGPPAEADRAEIATAVAAARRQEPDLDPSVFDFLHRLLTADLVAQPRSGFARHAVQRLAMKLQQYSGPIMAKGLEDTAFYRYNRLVALNEVGGHPDHFGVSLAEFHAANAARARDWPLAMLTTSTHDTKRGEDMRARLAALATLPAEWAAQVQGWSRLLRATHGAGAPDRNDEYLLYQLMLGAWEGDAAAMLPRLEGTLTKSLREAKRHSNWAAPDAAYEEASLAFLHRALDSRDFLGAFLPFQARIARLGLDTSLVQTALKLTLPGMPDTYQGAELWEFSLVDPDNRRPVDYARREAALADITTAMAQDRGAAIRALREDWRDGRLKLALTTTLLAHRAAQPALYAEGDYTPLAAPERLVAFARARGGQALRVVAARFPGEADWGGTRLDWPDAAWQDLLTGRVLRSRGGLDVAEALRDLPVAVFVRAA
ncbi:malto-oligosyltrehalose synthase [Falsiroseomonas selenitidurans]|uniref:Malto-oligosyltrehalose synthase n=1 Tax=Falsiroseomonas selenitidurans TaxID=2716335 RepID=A0ABX1E492_9PROT|nr:malto-oligosyltrehalose synthase [Falsiroseomonas selenitidurans]NKC31996.1 malto-oligosyltrehalose synthase [Falsiroseomonas selenitidurans]